MKENINEHGLYQAYCMGVRGELENKEINIEPHKYCIMSEHPSSSFCPECRTLYEKIMNDKFDTRRKNKTKELCWFVELPSDGTRMPCKRKDDCKYKIEEVDGAKYCNRYIIYQSDEKIQ